MERHLNLVKNNGLQQEKRILPRFPYCFLTFKGSGIDLSNIFEVKDISYSGMQLGLRDGKHPYQAGDKIVGNLHWLGSALAVTGVVRWNTARRLGVAFAAEQKQLGEMKSFLSVKNIVNCLRPLHLPEFGLELPGNLKYWLRADGPIEIFVWKHVVGEFSKIQLILLNNFVEWEDGKGLRTGVTLSNKKIDTPLVTEGEFVFEFDTVEDQSKVAMAIEIISCLPEKLIPYSVVAFLLLKLKS